MLIIKKGMWSYAVGEDPDFLERLKLRLTLKPEEGSAEQEDVLLYKETIPGFAIEIPTGIVDSLVLPYMRFSVVSDERKEIDIDVAKTLDEVNNVYNKMASFSKGFEIRSHQVEGTLKCLMNKRGICEAATGCFVGSTIILTDKGFETIQSLTENFVNKSVFCSDGQFHLIKSAHFTRFVKDTLKLRFNDGAEIECTPEHRFLLSSGVYDEAINLPVRGAVAGVYGERTVIAAKSVHYITPIPVYDIEVDCDLHNFALSNGVIAHNSGKTEIIVSLLELIKGKILIINNRTNILNQIEGRARLRGVSRKIEYLNKNPDLEHSEIIVSTNNLIWNRIKKNDVEALNYLKSISAIIVDECFVGTTPVLTDSGYKQIKYVTTDDLVLTYNETSTKLEYKKVQKNIEKPLLKSLVEVKSSGRSFVCTEDHKIFTDKGWKMAKELTTNDLIVGVKNEKECFKVSKHAMFNVWEIYRKPNKTSKRLLQKTQSNVLFKGMFSKEISRNCKYKYDKNESEEKRYYLEKNEREQSYEFNRDKAKIEEYFEEYELEANSKRRKWKRINRASKTIIRSFKLGYRVCCCNRSYQPYEISSTNKLQNRYSKQRFNDCYRSGWLFSLSNNKTRTRQKKRKVLNFSRVESVEIQKSGNNERFAKLCPESKVYDLTVEDNHNYFVNGFLVHNCHHGSCQSIAIPAMVANPEYFIGFTASPFKENGLCLDDIILNAVFGNSFYYISSKYLRGQGYSSFIYSYYINYPQKEEKKFCKNCAAVYKNYVAENFNRNEAALKVIKQAYNAGLKILIMVSRIEHGKYIISELKSEGIKSLFMCGKNTVYEAIDEKEKVKGITRNKVVSMKGDANFIKKKMREEGYNVIEGNVVFNEGIDVPEFDLGILLDAGKNVISHLQRIGRVCRRKENGINAAVFVDFNDTGHPVLEKWTRERKEHLLKEDIPIINKDNFETLIKKLGASRKL